MQTFKRLLLVVAALHAGFSAAATCSPELFSRLVPKAFPKLNASQISSMRASTQGLRNLRSAYHQRDLSKTLQRLYFDEKSPDALMWKRHPQLLRWNASGDSFLSLNTPYLNMDEIDSRMRDGTISELKNQAEGMSLLWWHIPEPIREHSVLSSAPSSLRAAGRLQGAVRISDWERTSNKNFLVTILDLTPEHLPYLKDLRERSYQALIETYGVRPSSDDVALYFHFPTKLETSVLHLHVRVNRPHHPLENQLSYGLDEVIRHLESGKSIDELILQRQKAQGMLPVDDELNSFLSTIDGIEVGRVANPYQVRPVLHH